MLRAMISVQANYSGSYRDIATDLEVNSVMSAEVLNHTVLQVKLITSTPFVS